MRPWAPESFDVEKESEVSAEDQRTLMLEELEELRSKVREEAFVRGFKEGIEEGRRQGFELGHSEGVAQGRSEGVRDGYQSGFEEGLKRLEPVGDSLRQSIEVVRQLPLELQSMLSEWVYETACRLAGRESMELSWFEAAVKEALGNLPRPGEHLIIRVAQVDLDAWRGLLASGEGSVSGDIQLDPDLSAGQAYVELRGARIDVGSEARRALVRSALGITLSVGHE